jgi:hypothetical protein
LLRTVKEIDHAIAIVNTLKVTMTGFNGTLEILTRKRKRKRRMRTSLLILMLLSLSLQGADLKPLTKRAVNEQIDTVILADIDVDGYTLAKLIERMHEFNPRINYVTYFPSTVVEVQVPALQPAASPQINPATGLPFVAPFNLPANGQAVVLPQIPVANIEPDPGNIKINTGNIPLKNITLRQLLDIACLGSTAPINYTVTDYGILIFKTKDRRHNVRRYRLVRPNLFSITPLTPTP